MTRGGLMNILLLGNGFDLNHMFPTWYLNFLNTTDFLIKADRGKLSSIGDVFGDGELQEKDGFIRKCYEVHKNVYSTIDLDKDKVEQMVSTATDNLWFNYLVKSVPENINWIDFEKEINRVNLAFTNFFENTNFQRTNDQVVFNFAEFQNGEDKYIIKSFPFFFDKMDNGLQRNADFAQICDKYLRENLSGSGTIHLCQDEIIETLYFSLRKLADLLKMYLEIFVDTASQAYKNQGIIPKFSSLPSAERVYSFNYTNTYETLYRPNIVEHIHGNTNTNIVLGVNPDDNDEIYNIDTSFLLFKKYFQRTFYSTDNDFLKKIYVDINARTMSDKTLYVIGHSLDATDKDIIKLIFESVDKIYVLYHSETSATSQIRNLVEMYGKQGLDRLRAEKNLCFLKQSGVEWDLKEN